MGTIVPAGGSPGSRMGTHAETTGEERRTSARRVAPSESGGRMMKRSLAALALALSLPGAARLAAADDPLLGKWWGTVVAPHETVEWGLSFELDAKGEIQVALTQPGANYFAMSVGGKAVRDGA